ncbi:hypothetical protein [Streptomyces sp. Ag109_O5-1]|uniref:hypothetical protein n=1 Tax=Streptomyces sp. Ag109_O5-1 TaxID=1938851 RepID=UPI0016233115|nr:hypothetical protein [Streptomyces sp. Ag109_O5-1]
MRDGLPLFREHAPPADARPEQTPARSGTLPGYTTSRDAIRHITLAILAHAFLAAMAAMAADAAAKGAAETVPALRPSPWQKFGGSWQLATHPSPLTSPSSVHAH